MRAVVVTVTLPRDSTVTFPPNQLADIFATDVVVRSVCTAVAPSAARIPTSSTTEPALMVTVTFCTPESACSSLVKWSSNCLRNGSTSKVLTSPATVNSVSTSVK